MRGRRITGKKPDGSKKENGEFDIKGNGDCDSYGAANVNGRRKGNASVDESETRAITITRGSRSFAPFRAGISNGERETC